MHLQKYVRLQSQRKHRHAPSRRWCALVPDLTGWLRYPHEGGLENGGVYVNPADTSVIYLLVGGYLCRTPRGVEEAEVWVEESEFDRYLEAKESSFI